MLWKVLSAISALCLGGAVFFALENSSKVKTEAILLARAESDLAKLLQRKQEGDDAQKAKQELFVLTEKERDQTKEDVVRTTAEAQEKEAALALLKANSDQVGQQVAALEKKIEDAGDIKMLIAQIDALKKDQLDAEGELANREQQIAAAQQRLVSQKQTIQEFEATEERIRRNMVDPDFSARVSGVFPDWGFVVINKGNAGGVFANALLDVKRGQDVIARLRVRNVEPATSVADVVSGSLAEGNVIRSGDLIVAAPDEVQPTTQTPSPNPSPVPAPDPGTSTPGKVPDIPNPFDPAPTTPSSTPPMSSDPFGSPPASSDPFGTPAPSSTPPSSSDPFGSSTPAPTPTPAPGSATPSPDPFG